MCEGGYAAPPGDRGVAHPSGEWATQQLIMHACMSWTSRRSGSCAIPDTITEPLGPLGGCSPRHMQLLHVAAGGGTSANFTTALASAQGPSSMQQGFVSCVPSHKQCANAAQVFRFYFRCNTCAAEMTMKTDPEHADYTVEQGASRNYEPWRDKDRWGAAQPIPSKPYNSETSYPKP